MSVEKDKLKSISVIRRCLDMEYHVIMGVGKRNRVKRRELMISASNYLNDIIVSLLEEKYTAGNYRIEYDGCYQNNSVSGVVLTFSLVFNDMELYTLSIDLDKFPETQELSEITGLASITDESFSDIWVKPRELSVISAINDLWEMK